MTSNTDKSAAGRENVRRLFVYNGGFLTQTQTKRILALSGYEVKLGAPGAQDLVGVWGNSPTAHRGEKVASQKGAGLVRVEDAWLRSLFPGRAGEPPAGLTVDTKGVHYDPSQVSDLEEILATHPLDDTALLDRARMASLRLQEAALTKYAAQDVTVTPPAPGYVIVVDQTQKDASVEASQADRNRFLEMLFVAQEEHPGARILIKSHPETVQGHRQGYFEPSDASDRVSFYSDPVNPWALLDGAIAVYTVSSQFGLEAIFAGHKPRVFGQPFYSGWGLTHDEFPVQRRQRTLTRAQLFAASYLIYPKWYDPFTDQLCAFETCLENMAALRRAWQEDHQGWVASGMRLWKRDPLQRIFGRVKPVQFEDDPKNARAAERPWMVWAGKAAVGHGDACRTEDGFLRSKGLGAELMPPLSLVVDDLGIYYDPAKPSRLERLIEARCPLRPDQQRRAEQLRAQIVKQGLTKYNIGGDRPDLPKGHRILVVGQVEDDASVQTGCTDIKTNRALLEYTRRENPNAVLIYKPHPDVEAGLRNGGNELSHLADMVANNADPVYLFENTQEVWTMTSLLGFEALIRGCAVTTVGTPFYAGWCLTTDRVPAPPRRRAEPTIESLIHASLIDYPRYHHPELDCPCPVEAAVDWLGRADQPIMRSWRNRVLSKIQGLMASQAHRWR